MAIAFDSSSGGSAFRASTSSVSWSHVLGSGTNRVVIASCGGIGNVAMTVTGITFNGTSMTAINTSIDLTGGARPMGWFYLPEASLPAAGTYTVVANFSTSNTDVIRGTSNSYLNVNQSGIPIVKNANFNGGSVSSLTTNVTVPSSGNWLVGFAESQGNENSITGGTVRTQTTASQDGQFSSYDSNGTVGTGSQGMTVGINTSTYLGFFVLSLEPPTGSVALTASTGSLTLTGRAATFSVGSFLSAATRSLLLTGYNAILKYTPSAWQAQTKNTGTFTAESKHTGTFNAQSKNTGSWTPQSKS